MAYRRFVDRFVLPNPPNGAITTTSLDCHCDTLARLSGPIAKRYLSKHLEGSAQVVSGIGTAHGPTGLVWLTFKPRLIADRAPMSIVRTDLPVNVPKRK